MLNQQENKCLRESNECAWACLQCASDCLEQEDPRQFSRCITLDMECADICHFAAVSIAGRDLRMKEVCAICADACQTCGIECASHASAQCRRCAVACKRCAEAFRNMVQ